MADAPARINAPSAASRPVPVLRNDADTPAGLIATRWLAGTATEHGAA
ncbi:hypothetical protein [Marinivivus vitaminiproducens]|nr:hypothetical protein P4R82_16400 [Geminicoccaceae bacterium SCSIO 64248]